MEDLCSALVELAEMGPERPSILHVAGPESFTRYDFAARLAEHLGHDPKKIPKANSRSLGMNRPERSYSGYDPCSCPVECAVAVLG